MGLVGTLARTLIRPLSRSRSRSSTTILSKLIQSPLQHQHQHHYHHYHFNNNTITLFLLPKFNHIVSRSVHLDSLPFFAPRHYDRLTDTRLPKRRPSLKPRRKRAQIRAKGPYAWVKHVEGEPIAPSQPNKGSVKQRNERKRRKQRLEFIKSEKMKRKAQLQAANQRKREKRVERKMAAVARDRDWAVRLTELKRQEEEKEKASA